MPRSSNVDAPIPFALSPLDTPGPYRPRFARLTGSLDTFVPRSARPCAPPPTGSDPRLAEAV